MHLISFFNEISNIQHTASNRQRNWNAFREQNYLFLKISSTNDLPYILQRYMLCFIASAGLIGTTLFWRIYDYERPSLNQLKQNVVYHSGSLGGWLSKPHGKALGQDLSSKRKEGVKLAKSGFFGSGEIENVCSGIRTCDLRLCKPLPYLLGHPDICIQRQ